jgi:hypothetical protein
MDAALVVSAVLGVGVLLSLPTLTAIGARRRGRGFVSAVMAGVFFPITWTVWYVRDESPYRGVCQTNPATGATATSTGHTDRLNRH